MSLMHQSMLKLSEGGLGRGGTGGTGGTAVQSVTSAGRSEYSKTIQMFHPGVVPGQLF